MWVDPGHGSQKAGIGDAEHSDPSVVPRDVRQEPLDRVVGIGALVHALRIARIVERAIHDELPLALVPAPDILRHEDVAVCGKEPIALGNYGITSDAIGRASEQKREWCAGSVRLTHTGVEMNAVSYGNRHEAAAVRRWSTLAAGRWGHNQQGEGGR